jgi:hypothetical protein
MPEFDFSSLANNPLLQYGMGLLKASGPSTQPHSFGQDLASAFDYQQGAQSKQLNNQLLKSVVDSGGLLKGGGTGVLAYQLMRSTGMDFPQALYAVQAGMRQGTAMSPEGVLSPMSGAPQAKGALKFGEEAGGQQAKLQYAGPIASAEQMGEAMGKAEGATARKSVQAPQIESLLQQAEGLLPKATSGGLATTGRDLAGYFGEATEGSEFDTQLDVIGAALTSGVPRMEGPQSNYDVKLYEKAAGDLANSEKPIEARLAAIKTMRNLNNKYMTTAPQDVGGILQGGGAQLPQIPGVPPGIMSGVANSPAGQGILSGQQGQGMQMPPQALGAQVPGAFDATGGAPQNNTAQTLQWAQEAIAKGADPQAVKQRLIEMGIQ